jgi:5-methylcytosine-specific restriction endonuclease McrA
MADGKNITATQVIDLIKAQSYRCAISGRPLTPETASLDHIVPLGRGGEHAITNVWVVDHQVNIAKGTLTLEEFVTMCRDIVACQEVKAKV